MSSHGSQLRPDENTRLGDLSSKLVTYFGAAGLILFAVSLVLGVLQGDAMRRFLHSYLVSFAFFLTIALGALFFVILQHLVGAKWSVVVRRIAELLTATFPLLAVLSLVVLIPVLAGSESLYFWNTADAEHDHLVHAKLGYLNAGFFAVRAVVYFAVWILISRYFLRRSLEQDRTGDASISSRLRARSGPSMIAFGLTTCYASFDLLMSLHPAWYSTMFGVYFFAGCAISIFAALSLGSLTLQRSGRLAKTITVEHYHDLGKLLFAFVFFWGYVSFSQFMLIWYADIPEETIWYKYRMFTSRKTLSLVMLFGHFILPFVMLLTRETKRRLQLLAFFSIWMLVMHFGDLFWVVMPEYNQDGLTFHLMDVTLLLALGGLFIATVARAARDVELIPVKDPGLSESLSFENY